MTRKRGLLLNIRTLTYEQYAKFLNDSHMAYSFLQSGDFARAHEAHETVRYYAGEEDGKILYAIYVIFRPAFRLFTYASSPREWVSASPELAQDPVKLEQFVSGMRQTLKKEGALLWLLESSVEYQPHDKNGDVVEGLFCNESYRDLLAGLGFEKTKLWRGYDERFQSRWVSWIDLQKNLPEISRGFPIALDRPHEMYTWPELMKEMAGNTRRSFQKADLPYLEYTITRGDENSDLSEFDTLLEQSAQKHNFNSGSTAGRQELLESFGPHGYVCISALNVPAYRTYLEEKEKEFSEREKEAQAVCEAMPNSKKKRNQLLEIQEQKAHNEKEMEALVELRKAEPADRIPLAGGIFFETPSEMVYLYGGSRPDLARFMGPYVTQKAMIRLALEHNLRRYNFWGISGFFKPDEEGYGVFYFKKNLGATAGEYCGEFTMVLHPLLGKTFRNKIRSGMLEK